MSEGLKFADIKAGDILISDAGWGDCIIPGKEYKVWDGRHGLTIACEGGGRARGDTTHCLDGHCENGVCLGFRRKRDEP